MRARTINRTALWLFYSLLAVAGMQSEAHAENVVLPTFGGQLHP
jgi:hypothetical protein